jgi:hypothetical protein
VRHDSGNIGDFVGPIAAAAVLVCFLAFLIWLIRQITENRRWGRIFKLQSEVHGRLIEKFNSSQELGTYMNTEAGRRFLEAAPIPVGFEPEQRIPNAVARVLWPLQIGIVLVLGTVVLMPGVGFIISAGITWVLAGRLGLMPENPSAADKLEPPSGSQDRQ